MQKVEALVREETMINDTAQLIMSTLINDVLKRVVIYYVDE